MLQPCRTVDHYEKLNKIDEGSYGVVFRARDRQTGEVVALKKVKLCREEEDEVGFPITSLREINLLRCLHHPCIVAVKEVVHGRKQDAVFLVMEYLEHDLRSVMEDMVEPFSQSEVKCLMLQLLDGVAHMHEHWVMHRDLKPANLLLGHGGQLKICDFGLARLYGSPLQAYSPTVVTLWYRAPELLLGAHRYSKAVDVWSVGCIMAELLSKEPLFGGKTEIDQLKAIFGVVGAPADGEWPEGLKPPDLVLRSLGRGGSKLRERFSQVPVAGRPALSARGVDLLSTLLAPNPETRISAGDALKHDWFSEEPLPRSKASMPRLPARRDFESRRRNKRKLDAEEEG